MIRTTNVRNGRIDLGDCKYVEKETFEKWTRRAKLQRGDVVLTREAPIGEVGLVMEADGVFLGQRLMQYRANRNVLEPRFLLYSFLSPALQHQFGSHEGSGSVVSHIRVGDCFKFKLPIPPLDVQQGIATLLGALDDRITLLRETNATLEAIAQALFKSWFVDFDPVRAKRDGRVPEGMDEATAALFPDGLEESELGWVPRGWRTATVAAVSTQIFSGGTPDTRKPEFWAGTLPWFSSGETRNRVVTDTEKRITQDAVKNSSTKLALPGDILIASAGQGHTRGQTSYCALETYINQSVVSIRADKDICSSLWLFCNLSRRYEEMRNISDSHSSRGSLTTKLLGGMRLTLPNESVIKAFSNIAEDLMCSQKTNSERIATLSDVRDSLLPRLISGQLRLPEAEAEALAA